MRSHLAEQVRSSRKAAGKTQRDIAEATGFSHHYIYLIERGECTPMKISTLVRLSNALSISLDTLISTVIQDRTNRLHNKLKP